jgi:hypothetical protein
MRCPAGSPRTRRCAARTRHDRKLAVNYEFVGNGRLDFEQRARSDREHDVAVTVMVPGDVPGLSVPATAMLPITVPTDPKVDPDNPLSRQVDITTYRHIDISTYRHQRAMLCWRSLHRQKSCRTSHIGDHRERDRCCGTAARCQDRVGVRPAVDQPAKSTRSKSDYCLRQTPRGAVEEAPDPIVRLMT